MWECHPLGMCMHLNRTLTLFAPDSNPFSPQDGSVLQSVVIGSGAIQTAVWIPEVGVAACSNRSKVRQQCLNLCVFWPLWKPRWLVVNQWIWMILLCEFWISNVTNVSAVEQDVLVVNCTSEWISANHVLATCRTALKQQGVLGLNMAPCMRAFLERLPVMLQEQYAYEKVGGVPVVISIHGWHQFTV